MTLKVEVPDELGAVLEAHAQAQGVSPDRLVRQVLEETFARELGPSTGTLRDAEPNIRRRPIWDAIADNMKDVPRDVLDQLPKDGASQHDHYIYGWPKREA